MLFEEYSSAAPSPPSTNPHKLAAVPRHYLHIMREANACHIVCQNITTTLSFWYFQNTKNDCNGLIPVIPNDKTNQTVQF